jgi:hypothetical protein
MERAGRKRTKARGEIGKKKCVGGKEKKKIRMFVR